MVYKPEMDKRAQRPKEQAQQGKDITRIADGQEKSAKSIENLIGQQKIANENLETGFDALQKSQKTSFIKRNLDNAFEIFYTRKGDKEAHKQRGQFQKEHLKDDKRAKVEFKTSDKKTDLREDQLRHLEAEGETEISILGKVSKGILGLPENINKIIEKSTTTVIESIAKAASTEAEAAFKSSAHIFGQVRDAAEAQNKKFDAAAEVEKQKKASLRAHHAGLRIFGKTRLKAADHFAKKVEEQQKSLDEMQKSMDSVGKTAMSSFRFRKAQRKLIMTQWKQERLAGSRDSEKKAKDRMMENVRQTTLFRMAKGIGKMAGWMGKAAKTVVGKFPSFGKLLTLGAFGAILAFMNSPAMAKVEKFILENVIPKFGTWYDEKFEPMWKRFLKFIEETTIPGVWEGIEQSLTNMGPIFTDIGNIVKALGEGGILEAFKHTLTLVKDIMVLIIDGVGNVLKSLGLVDFEGPSAVKAWTGPGGKFSKPSKEALAGEEKKLIASLQEFAGVMGPGSVPMDEMIGTLDPYGGYADSKEERAAQDFLKKYQLDKRNITREEIFGKHLSRAGDPRIIYIDDSKSMTTTNSGNSNITTVTDTSMTNPNPALQEVTVSW